MPLKFFVDKFSHVRFEPERLDRQPADPLSPSPSWTTSSAGWGEVPRARVRLPREAGDDATTLRPTEPEPQQKLPFAPAVDDAPVCAECGGLMTRNGSCYKCDNCGGTSGCS